MRRAPVSTWKRTRSRSSSGSLLTIVTVSQTSESSLAVSARRRFSNRLGLSSSAAGLNDTTRAFTAFR